MVKRYYYTDRSKAVWMHKEHGIQGYWYVQPDHSRGRFIIFDDDLSGITAILGADTHDLYTHIWDAVSPFKWYVHPDSYERLLEEHKEGDIYAPLDFDKLKDKGLSPVELIYRDNKAWFDPIEEEAGMFKDCTVFYSGTALSLIEEENE